MDEYILLWAQWGILRFDHYQYLKSQFGDLKEAWKKTDLRVLEKLGFGGEKRERISEIRERLDFHGLARDLENLRIRVIFIEDAEYPECLKQIPQPPVFLFVRGKLPLLHKAVGVVGTRDITPYGRAATEKTVGSLAQNGFVIVSGLALGVDTCAHETALASGAVTLAVLGSGVDEIYPISNSRLAERIIEKGGALISEYPLGTPALQHHFPVRNRIISGLSRGVLIMECGHKSGALITARYALEQGREVFAVPSAITRAGESGTNRLIRRGEAKLIERAEDILEEFNLPVLSQPKSLPLEADEIQLLKLIGGDGKSIDDLAELTGYNVARLSDVLIRVQLKGAAREIGRRWMAI